MPFSLISPDAPGYAGQCRSIAAKIAEGLPVFMRFEHDGEAVQIMLCLVRDAEWYGSPEGIAEDGAWAAVSVIHHGAAFFPLAGFIDHRRVIQSLAVSTTMGIGITDLLVRIGSELKGAS